MKHNIPSTISLSYERLRNIRKGRDKEYVHAPGGDGIVHRTTGAVYNPPRLSDAALRADYGELITARRPLDRSELRRALRENQSLDAIERAHVVMQFGDFFQSALIPYAVDGRGQPIPSKKIRDEYYFKFKYDGKFYPKDEAVPYQGTILNTGRSLIGRLGRGGFLGSQRDGIYMGVELETGCKNENMRDLFYALAGWCELKTDGSLDSIGVEIATRPMPYHLQKKKWRQFYKTMSGKLENEDNGGVHIHISYPKTAPHVRNLFYFIHADINYPLLSKIGRRPDNQRYARYGHVKSFAESDRIHDRHDKYQALASRSNGSHETLEFRLFKTTRQAPVMISYLEFVRAVVDYTKLRHTNEATLTWEHFARYVAKRRNCFPQLFRIVNDYALERGVTL